MKGESCVCVRVFRAVRQPLSVFACVCACVQG